MSWTYQSNNPCSVLVKEKQDGLSRHCQTPILQSSSTETAASSQDQPELTSSLGNSVGGKERRYKRQALKDVGVDVVFDGDGHDDKPHITVEEKRILLNISIVMDGGLGSLHQEVYQLHAAVPLPNEFRNNFYAYNVSASERSESSNTTSTDKLETSTFSEVDDFTEDSMTKGLKNF